MTTSQPRKRGATLGLLLAIALSAPASTLALPLDDASKADPSVPRLADTPSAASIWDQPATPVVIVRPPAPPPIPPKRELSANPLWEIPLSTLSSTRERPIFSPSRRPPPPAAAAAPLAAQEPAPKPPRIERPELSLVGTIAGEEESFGIFLDQTTKAGLRLKIGEDYQGWKLRAVRRREVTLERDKQTAILSLPQPGEGSPGTESREVENAANPSQPNMSQSPQLDMTQPPRPTSARRPPPDVARRPRGIVD